MVSFTLKAASRMVLAWLLPVLLVFAGCGEPVKVLQQDAIDISATPGAGGGSGSGTLSAASTPATLLAVSPVAVQAGSAASVLTLSATGIGIGAKVLVDGVAHAATLQSSTSATLLWTEAELARGTRHTLSIQNPGLAASNDKTVLVTEGHWAFGDSITFGYGVPNPSTGNYAYLLAAAYRLTLVNSAKSGDQACDVWAQILHSGAGYTGVAAPLFSLMIGTNDVDIKGTGAYEIVFTACDLAALSWLGTPRTAKVLAEDAALAKSGACSGSARADLLGAIACSGGPGAVTVTLRSSGNPIYLWYLISDSASAGDGITVTLDGAAAGTFATLPVVPIATQNGNRQGITVVRLPAAAGSHTLSIATTGFAGVLGVGSNPATGTDHPRLLVGDLPNQAYGSPVAPIASQLIYIGHTIDVEQMLQADGMDIHRALTRTYMLGTVYEMADQLHPNIVGQQQLEKAFAAALP